MYFVPTTWTSLSAGLLLGRDREYANPVYDIKHSTKKMAPRIRDEWDRHRGSGHHPARPLRARAKKASGNALVNISGGFSAFDFRRIALEGAAGGSVIVVSA
jgi:hypothetical protein